MVRENSEDYPFARLPAKTPVDYPLALSMVLMVCFYTGCGRKPDRASTPLHQAAKSGDLMRAHKLITQGVRLNAACAGGNTPLHEAVNHKQPEMVRLLVSHGADINAKNDLGSTALHRAIFGGPGADLHGEPSDIDMVRFLVASGADVNRQTNDGVAPLHLAALRGDVAMIRLLLDCGAELAAENEHGNTPLCFALALQQGKAAIALINAGAALTESSLGSAPLHDAAHMGDEELMTLLIDKGADVNARIRAGRKEKYSDYWEGRTPIHMAASKGDFEAVQILLANGAQVDARDVYGRTALHEVLVGERYCPSQDKIERVVRLLIDHDADVNAVDDETWAPLHYAARHGYVVVVRVLLEHGANAGIRNRDGNTPGDLARQRHHTEIADLLEEFGA